MNYPTCGGGGGPSGGPKEKQLFSAAYTASPYSIDDAMTQIDAAKKNLDVVTTQLDKLVPLLQESWTSSDGQAAVKSTKDLSSTLSQKALQLHDSSQALQTAKKAVDEAQTYWSNHQPPPAAPPAPDYFDYGSSSDYATAVGQYNTDKKSYDGTVDSREAAMETQYNLLQKQLDNAGTALAKANSIEAWDTPPGGGSTTGGSGGGLPGGSTGGGLPPTTGGPQPHLDPTTGGPDYPSWPPPPPPATPSASATATATPSAPRLRHRRCPRRVLTRCRGRRPRRWTARSSARPAAPRCR